VTVEGHGLGQPPSNFVEVAHSEIDGDLDAAANRLEIESVPFFAVLTTYVPNSYSSRHVLSILVPPWAVDAAQEIIDLVRADAFDLGDDGHAAP